jgi:RNA ligase (TIGR02306 family)
MSTFSCPVVRVTDVTEHPNADRLSIIRLEGLGFTCVSAKLPDGAPRYKVGDWLVYIPSDSVLPEWLLKHMGFWDADSGKGTLAGSDGNRVKPMRLRGVFSEGVLYPCSKAWWGDTMECAGYMLAKEEHGEKDAIPVDLGDDASMFLGVIKYEPTIPTHMKGEVANLHGLTVKYDFERHERVMHMFPEGHPVVAMEKAHGTCCEIRLIPGLNHPEMFGESGDVIVASKGRAAAGLAFKNVSENDHTIYVRVLRELLSQGLEARMRSLVGHLAAARGMTVVEPLCVTIMLEVFGSGIQDLHYGTTQPQIGVFDVQVGAGWLPHADLFGEACAWLELPALPQLYKGPFDVAALEAVRDGVTQIGGTHVREGIVVRCAHETQHAELGRRIMKMISPAYLTRKTKSATEYN